MATDTEGIPIHLEVLRGNRTDTTTLHGLLASLKRRFGIRRAVFVFDNGMSSTLNLEAMRKEDLHFVTRLSTATLREVVAQSPQEDQPQLWDRTKLIELTLEGKRYVIAGGVYRQQRDFARRSAQLEKAQKELKRLAAVRRRKPDAQKLASQAGRALQRLKAHKYFAYWLCAKLGYEWRAKGEKGEIQCLLRQLQAIRVGTLKIAGQDSKRLLTQIPPQLNSLLAGLGLLPRFKKL